MIRITREDIANSVPTERCRSYSIGRSLNRTNGAAFVRKPSPITTISYLITSIREAWEDRGEMITQIISKLFTGGAMERRDRAGYR
jgi:hypothetical protein